METWLANLTGILGFNNPATKHDDLCGCEFNMKVSALKSKGKKKLRWCSVPANNMPSGPCSPVKMP